MEAVAHRADTASHSVREMGFSVKMCELSKYDEAFVNLLAG